MYKLYLSIWRFITLVCYALVLQSWGLALCARKHADTRIMCARAHNAGMHAATGL